MPNAHKRILLVYGTRYGQTARIAGQILALLTSRNFDVTELNAADLPDWIDPRSFDGVIVGASVIRSKHQASVQRFVRRHVATLNNKPSAFFSVSGAASSQNLAGRAAAEQLMHEFVDRCGWKPRVATVIGGAVAYTRYSPMVRWFMKRIARRTGRSTDTSRDHEYTNWADVEQFAHRFIEALEPPPIAATVAISATATVAQP